MPSVITSVGNGAYRIDGSPSLSFSENLDRMYVARNYGYQGDYASFVRDGFEWGGQAPKPATFVVTPPAPRTSKTPNGAAIIIRLVREAARRWAIKPEKQYLPEGRASSVRTYEKFISRRIDAQEPGPHKTHHGRASYDSFIDNRIAESRRR